MSCQSSTASRQGGQAVHAAPNAQEPASATPAAVTAEQVEPSAEQDEARRALRGLRSRNRPLVSPSVEQLTRYRSWVAEVLSAIKDKRRPRVAPPPGFVLREVGPRYWLLAEAPEQRRGAGALLLRTGEARAIAVEAPHTFYDAGTLPIALELFQRLTARALLINTVHRAAGVPDEEKVGVIQQGRAPADVAHIERSLFAEAHALLAQDAKDMLVVQLHGYSDERSPGVAAVVSAAHSPFAGASALADNLSASLGGVPVAAYPRDTRDLGGTHNRQAQHSRAASRPFLHIELSAALRRRLRAEPAAAAALAARIAAAHGWMSGR